MNFFVLIFSTYLTCLSVLTALLAFCSTLLICFWKFKDSSSTTPSNFGVGLYLIVLSWRITSGFVVSVWSGFLLKRQISVLPMLILLKILMSEKGKHHFLPSSQNEASVLLTDKSQGDPNYLVV